jgi:hypothetical protein
MPAANGRPKRNQSPEANGKALMNQIPVTKVQYYVQCCSIDHQSETRLDGTKIEVQNEFKSLKTLKEKCETFLQSWTPVFLSLQT